MQITRQADYAVRAVLYLARLEPNQRAATSQVAKEQHIPPSFLAKIISQLSIAGLLHTSRGARGGVTLAREPKEIITCLRLSKRLTGRSCSMSALQRAAPALLMRIVHCALCGARRRRNLSTV